MTELAVDADVTVASLVAERPRYASVFEDLDIDYCCNGDRSLRDACRANDVALETAVERLEAAEPSEGDEPRTAGSPEELIEHVVASHHDYLREELPAIGDLAATVADVHGDGHPELIEVRDEFRDLAEAIRTHIDEEEDDVFPAVERLVGDGALADGDEQVLREALDDLEEDHRETADRLDRIAELTDGYAVPEDACTKYRVLLDRLQRLERDVHAHVHEENNVLFPRVEEALS